MQVCGRKVLQVKGIASAKALRLTVQNQEQQKLIRPQQRVGRGGDVRDDRKWPGGERTEIYGVT